jgi:hypothetical protein
MQVSEVKAELAECKNTKVHGTRSVFLSQELVGTYTYIHTYIQTPRTSNHNEVFRNNYR